MVDLTDLVVGPETFDLISSMAILFIWLDMLAESAGLFDNGFSISIFLKKTGTYSKLL